MRTRTILRMRRIALLAATVVGGTAFANSGCTNTLLSLTPCGTIVSGCTAGDWANLIFPYLDLPDFEADPACTIPGACGPGSVQPGIPGFVAGQGVVQPEENQSQGAGGALGGGGGGGI